MLKEKEKNDNFGFSGAYTFITVLIIIIDIGLVVLFSVYIILAMPTGRHTRERQSAFAKGKYSSRQGQRPVVRPSASGTRHTPERRRPTPSASSRRTSDTNGNSRKRIK